MKIFQEYNDYLNDNPNHYWFKRKLYGWGWVPVTWQGWLTIGIFIIFLLVASIPLDVNPEPTTEQLVWFFAEVLLAVVAVIAICYKKGEKPKWQWGLPKKED